MTILMKLAVNDSAKLVFGALLILVALAGFGSGFLFPYWCLSWTDQSESAFLLEMLGLFIALQALSCVMLLAGIHLLAKRTETRKEPCA